jgi:hypothetical protein
MEVAEAALGSRHLGDGFGRKIGSKHRRRKRKIE